MAPQVRYTKNRDGHIAYETFGGGDLELVIALGPLSHLEVLREQPDTERFLERLGRFARVAVFDRRGMGLSDPLSRPVTLEEQVEDLEAVINAAGFQCPALLGLSDQGRTCILFAATHPGRIRALVTAGTAPYGAATMTPEYAGSLRYAVEHAWGQAQLIEVYAPGRKDDLAFREWCMRAERMSASPQAMLNIIETISRADVRGVLATVQTPTLVLHRRGDRVVSPELGRELAEAIPHARFVEVPGDDALYLLGDIDALADQVEEFLTGTRSDQPSDRILASLLVTDIVRSTERVHTGECELVADDLRGLAVHIAARIAALAEAHEILVSRTVKDLVVGSGIEFTDRGTQALKGVPGKWPTYAVQ